MSVTRFKADLVAFAKKTRLDLSTVKRKVTLDLFEKITHRSPVDTGRLRSSWAVSDGMPSEYVAPEGTKTFGRMEATFALPAEPAWIVNNLPYAISIEFEGKSRQAPSGMLRVSLAEVQAELQSKMEKL